MKSYIIPFLILFIQVFNCVTTQAQKTTMYGIVTMLNSGNKPLSGVEVYSDWAITSTDSDGTFELTFSDRDIGDFVQYEVFKEGYEVVNPEILDITLTGSGDYIHKVVMCKKGERTKNRLKYYNIAMGSITKEYELQLDKLNKANQDYQDQVLKLQKDTAIALQQARRFAEKYASVNLDDASDSYRKAFEYYERGLIDSALSVLDSATLAKQKQKIRDIERLLDKAKEDLQKLKGIDDVSGYIREYNKGIEGVQIQVEGIDKVTYTNTEGFFTLKIPLQLQQDREKYTLHFFKEGYVNQKEEILIPIQQELEFFIQKE